MGMKGTTCMFNTWCTTDQEFQNFRQILLSNEDHWDPPANIFQISVMEEDISYSVDWAPTPSWNIDFVHLNSDSLLPPVGETQDGVNIHNSYQCNAALGIKHTPCFYYFLQVNIKVPSSTMKAMTDYSDKRFSEVSDEQLYLKWGLGLENSKATLDVMMQMNFRQAILPLTKRYRTDLFSQKLRSLRVNLYTETLFSDETYVRGNKCAQLYAYGEGFLHVFLMRSKAGACD